jgi:hypothetical protein
MNIKDKKDKKHRKKRIEFIIDRRGETRYNAKLKLNDYRKE